MPSYQRLGLKKPAGTKPDGPPMWLMIAGLGLVALLVLGGGYWATTVLLAPPEPTPTPTATSTATPGAPVVTLGPPPTSTAGPVPATPTPFSVMPLPETRCYVREASWLNAQPNPNSVGIDKVNPAQALTVTGQSGEWYQVRVPNSAQAAFILQSAVNCP